MYSMEVGFFISKVPSNDFFHRLFFSTNRKQNHWNLISEFLYQGIEAVFLHDRKMQGRNKSKRTAGCLLWNLVNTSTIFPPDVDLLVALEEKSGDHQSQWGSVSGHHEYLYKVSSNSGWDNFMKTCKTKHLPYGVQTIPVSDSGCGSGWDWREGGLHSVQGVQCSHCGLQLWYRADVCGKTQAPADLASSWKANASSEVGPAFEVLECRPGYHRSESPCSVGKPALNLSPLRCSRAPETD